MERPGGLRGDTGETLVETLVALAILSLAAVAILAGVELSTKASDIHRKQTTGGAYVRSYAEAIEKYVNAAGADNYKPCAGADSYNISAVTSQLDLPSGYSAHHTAALGLTSTGGTTSCTDIGVQRLDLTIASSDSRASEQLTIILRRPCDSGVTC
jgi:type II secretory pathway pseudopilin PulG